METNNKMREAVKALVSEIGDYSADGLEVVWCGIRGNTIKMLRAALAAPRRNCDVGSVAEQKERFKDFCKEGKLSRIDLGAYCAYDCPSRDSYDCKLEWAQMPYEEGGVK